VVSAVWQYYRRMRRTDRLFAIIQTLRAKRHPVTARALADELEVSVRTLYRDVAELVAQRVPIRGEAGTGYVIDPGYALPPLMLTADELEAAMLGMAWVSQRGDPALARGARSLIEKLTHVVPKELRPVLLDAQLHPVSFRAALADALDIAPIRQAIRERRKLTIAYADGEGKETARTIWPFMMAYTEDARVVAAHCELRGGFRHFRTDRIRAVRLHDERYPESPKNLKKRWDLAYPRRS
jgi:predicted DNA-binding transcriptional regulator YafY